MDHYLKANQSSWDMRADVHFQSDFYNVDAFKEGKTSLRDIELRELTEVEGKSLLHLQCHFGQDTLSWARLGAKVTGIDFSGKAIAYARQLAEELKIDARFVKANVLELDQHLEGSFDIIFTSYGVLGWLPDLRAWAKQVNHFLKPGGVFYIVEFHPVLYMLEFDPVRLHYPYFNKQMLEEVVTGTYTDRSAIGERKEYYWCHSLQDTLDPFLKRDYHLEFFHEFPYSMYNCFENMEPQKDGYYVFKALGENIPYHFSFKMRKPLH